MQMAADLYKFQTRLGVSFADIELLRLALTHRSVSNENNERLEFLGDAILGMIIAELLFLRYPNIDEGELSRYRSALVRKETLAQLAKQYDFDSVLILGSCELKSGASRQDSILADSFEAIIGALYLDNGFEKTSKFLARVYQDKLANLPACETLKDSKSRLQELLQARNIELPKYSIIEQKTTHPQQFTVQISIQEGEIKMFATATSRKKAEQAAAEQVLQSNFI